MDDRIDIHLSRRSILKAGAISATAAVVPSLAGAQSRPDAGVGKGGSMGASMEASAAPVLAKLTINVNGKPQQLEVDTPIAEFHRLPGKAPHIDTVLEPGELITGVTLPAPLGGVHLYRKVRDRASYAFTLVSVAAVIQKDGSGRIALGGVAHKPWRVEAAEAQLPRGARAVAEKLLAGAKATEENAFKITLAERTLAAVLSEAKG